MASKQAAREESWTDMHPSEVPDELGHGYQDYDQMSVDDQSEADDMELRSPPPPTNSDVLNSLHPLRATAERVGKQVERFAEHLDRYNEQRLARKHKDCRDVLPLVNEYRKIASDTVRYLRGIHSPGSRRSSRDLWKRRLRSSSGRPSSVSSQADQEEDQAAKTTRKDLKTWEQEEETWNLLASMLQVEFPIPQSVAGRLAIQQQHQRPKGDTEVHRFSSEKAAWNRFLAEDDLAWERHTVVEWLKTCADKSGDIEAIVKDLDDAADRVDLDAHSWKYSQDVIKSQKLFRSWTQPLDPDGPPLDLFVTDSNKTKNMVTQLDPDAVTRQGRHLETQDLDNERAFWLACWEMLRRGKDWTYIHDWCMERGEGWRAVALRGDPRASPAANTPIANSWQSRALWRNTCATAAKHGGVNQYENAIYGALGGHLPSVMKVCGTWNDFLFAHYNSYLLAQFDDYVHEKFLDRIPRTLTKRSKPSDFKASEDHRGQSGKEVVERMKRLESTKKQAATLTKMLQGSLIAKTFDDFVVQQGASLGQSANAQQKSKIIAEPSGQALRALESGVTAPINLQDHDVLRVVTHTFFIFQDLGLKVLDADRASAAENIVAAYLDFLSKAGKQQLLPLYASRLSPARATDCLARQLPIIQDHTERQTVMSLMEQSGIEVPDVLMKQLTLIIEDAPQRPRGSAAFPQLEVLEPAANNIGLVRPIKKAFIGNSISGDEQDLINGFQWYLLLEGNWELTMNMGTIVYKHFLRLGSLAAGRELLATMSFRKLSLNKTKTILGETLDLSKEPEYDDSIIDENGYDSPEDAYRAADQKYLLSEARAFRDLERLFVALDAFERWKDAADKAVGFTKHSEHAAKVPNNVRSHLKEMYVGVEAAIAPLLHQGWLQYPRDEDEAPQFEALRRACLPEMVLAYAHVLDVSARFLSRDLLLDSMDLAAMIAAEGSDIAACFVDAGRMAELVTAFAFTSQGIIAAQERSGGAKKSKKKLDGRSLEIWTTKV